jgi:hypothetical protein
VQLHQEFIDLRFGLFIHFNLLTFSTGDWPDPQIPAAVSGLSQPGGARSSEKSKSSATFRDEYLRTRVKIGIMNYLSDGKSLASKEAVPLGGSGRSI